MAISLGPRILRAETAALAAVTAYVGAGAGGTGANRRARMTTRTDPPAARLIEGRDDLLSVFSGGEKPREHWRIGTEHEKFVYRCATIARRAGTRPAASATC